MASDHSYEDNQRGNLVIDTKFDEEFLRSGNDKYTVKVAVFNGVPKVGISRYFFSDKYEAWYPSRSHCYMQVSAWTKLKEIANRATKYTDALFPAPNGMEYFLYFDDKHAILM